MCSAHVFYAREGRIEGLGRRTILLCARPFTLLNFPVSFDQETDIVGCPVCSYFEAISPHLDVEVDKSKKASLPAGRRGPLLVGDHFVA